MSEILLILGGVAIGYGAHHIRMPRRGKTLSYEAVISEADNLPVNLGIVYEELTSADAHLIRLMKNREVAKCENLGSLIASISRAKHVLVKCVNALREAHDNN